MRLCKIKDLKCGDILAQSVLTPDYNILLSEGTILNKEYIKRLDDFYIEEVFIVIDKDMQRTLLVEDIEIAYKKKVKSVLERHIYQRNDELMVLAETADLIIGSILEEKEVVDRIYELRERAPDVYEHSISVCSLSVLVALKCGLDKEVIHDIGVGSILHDLGLRYLTTIYTEIDINLLNPNDIAEYKKHPVNAYSTLLDENWISEKSKLIILNHHENLDGSGFPLKVKKLSFESKIVNVCDAFDEMICGIGCERKKVHDAIEELKKYSNIKYEKKAVDTLLQMTAVYPVGTLVKTNEGEIGIVMRQNENYPDKPYIKIVKDKIGNTVLHDMVKDLALYDNLYIENAID